MADRTDTPVFTGAELALADTIILILNLLMLHGMADRAALDRALAELQGRYQGQNLFSATAMAAYFRHHATDADHEVRIAQLRDLFGHPRGSA